MAKKDAAPADSSNSQAEAHSLESGEKVENFAGDEGSDLYQEALKLYPAVQKAYDGKQEQSDNIEEYWNIYQAKADANQAYSGNSQAYVPAVRDCVNARVKRRLKQLFPTRHRHVEAVGSNGDIPFAQLALIEHYIRKTKLKEIVRSDLVAGDVTGQWNLYIDWTRSYRRITEDIRRNPSLEIEGAGAALEQVDLEDPTEEEDATEETDILEEGPEIVDFATEDLAVVPPTCNDIEKADAVSLRLRMSKEKVKSLVDSGVFVTKEGEDIDLLWESLEKNSAPSGKQEKRDPDKRRTQDAGVKTEGAYKHLMCYEVTAKLSFDEGEGKKVKRLAYVYFANQNRILGIVKAKQWGGKRPILSAPVDRVKGSFFGISKIEPVKFLQWNLTDYWNMGQDSAMYSLLPVWAVDPLANPTWSMLVMGLAAVWPVDPNKVKQITQQQLYKEALTICSEIKRQIWESMDVNEMMMGKMPAGRKNNQLMGTLQQESMTNIMDDAERYEETMLSPLAERLMEYDRQFRTAKLTVVTMGEIGERAKMTEIEPQAFGERYRYQWAGTSIVQGQQLQQARIAGLNVLRGIPPQQLNGRRLDVTPVLERFTEDLYGPELAPKILIDERNQFTIDPETENLMLNNGIAAVVHEADIDPQHMQSHAQAAALTGDPKGLYRAHIAAHQMQMNAKMMKQQQAMQGQPGAPGAGPPGIPGSPRVGAVPAGPRPGMQNPPGLPGADQAAGPGRG